MAEFVCRLGTESGRVVNETFQATSEEELRSRLAAQGYLVLKIRPHQTFSERIGNNKQTIPRDDFLIFNQQFLALSKSGLPLQKSLEMLAKQAGSSGLRSAIENVRDRVSAGALLSDAFEASGKFPKVYCATVKAGERSGSLDKVLGQYLTYQKARRSFSKKFLSAMAYPAILLIVLSIMIVLVTTYVIPEFSKLYHGLNVPLPALTVFVMSIGRESKNIAITVALLAIGGMIFVMSARQSRAARMTWERVKLRIPKLGDLLKKFAVAEFTRTLGTLLAGGAPVVAALTTARDSVSNPLVAEAIDGARKEVTAGRGLAASLRMTDLFPELALDMIEVGEATGSLATMLESVADFYEEDVGIGMNTLVAIVDPIVLIIIASVVFVILAAFYLPFFSLAGKMH